MQTVFLVGVIISLILMMLVLFVGLVIFRMKKENKVAKRLIIAVEVISIIAYIVCVIGFGLSTPYADYEYQEYQQNLERKQEQKYELLSLEYSEELQSWTTSGEKDGIYLLLYKNESYNTEGEVTYEETYQFHYIKDPNTGEVGQMELDVSETRIFLTKNGENPYLLETVIQPYTVDNNWYQPTITYGDPIITYSLYIPKESIAGDVEITE